MLTLVMPSQSCNRSPEYLPVRYSCLLLLQPTFAPKKLNLNLKTKPNSHLAQQRICRTISLPALVTRDRTVSALEAERSIAQLCTVSRLTEFGSA